MDSLSYYILLALQHLSGPQTCQLIPTPNLLVTSALPLASSPVPHPPPLPLLQACPLMVQEPRTLINPRQWIPDPFALLLLALKHLSGPQPVSSSAFSQLFSTCASSPLPYPMPLPFALGMSPSWYKSRAYRARCVLAQVVVLKARVVVLAVCKADKCQLM